MQDPMDAHPHQADIDCLNRQANVHDIVQASNPSSAYGVMGVLRIALSTGNKGMLASFFETEYSPSVVEYKKREREAQQLKDGTNSNKRMSASTIIMQQMELSALSTDFLAAACNSEEFVEGKKEKKLERAPSSRMLAKEALIKQSKRESKRMLISKPSPMKNRVSSVAESIYDIMVENEEFRSNEGEDGAKLRRKSHHVSLVDSIDDADFESKILPEEMRCLALMAHSHMKPAMQKFISANKNLLKKFVLTGNDDTMVMLTEIYKADPTVKYGPTCQSGPLGGDAQLCALMCLQELGGMIFFQDPMEAHAHQADIDCLNRQCNVHDIFISNNVSSAFLMTSALRHALKIGNSDRIESFLSTRVSPSVAEYKRRQNEVSKKMSEKNNFGQKTAPSRTSMLGRMMSIKSTKRGSSSSDNEGSVKGKSLRGFFNSKSFKKKKNKKKKANGSL